MKKIFGLLRSNGAIPTAVKGGGKGAVHFEYYHLAVVVACMASQGPGGALDAVRALARLDWEKPEPGDFSVLLNVIAAEISIRASRIVQGQEPDDANAAEWTLTVCLDPLQAWISWQDDGKEIRRNFSEQQSDLLKSPQTERKGLRRLTVFDRHVFNTTAALYADTIQHKAEPKGTAAPLPGGAADRDQNQKPTLSASALDAKRDGISHQVQSVNEPGHSPKPQRSAKHARRVSGIKDRTRI